MEQSFQNSLKKIFKALCSRICKIRHNIAALFILGIFLEQYLIQKCLNKSVSDSWNWCMKLKRAVILVKVMIQLQGCKFPATSHICLWHTTVYPHIDLTYVKHITIYVSVTAVSQWKVSIQQTTVILDLWEQANCSN